MVLLDKFFNLFFDHAIVINENEQALQKDVQLLQKKYGPWFRVRGFTDYKSFFFAVHIARINHCPITSAFIKDSHPAGEMILKQADPNIRTYKYSNTKELDTICLS